MEIQIIYPRKTQVTFDIKPIPCNDFTGPIKMKIILLCISQWCNKRNITSQIFDYTENGLSQQFHQLQPYTNYTLMMSTSRNQNKWIFDESVNFQTNIDGKKIF